jgi:hypothetical protein
MSTFTFCKRSESFSNRIRLFPDVVFNPIVIVDMIDHAFHYVAFAKVVQSAKSAGT